MTFSRETIVAVATPPGMGGIGVVRTSGDAVPSVATALLGFVPEPRVATLATFRNDAGEPIDQGIALYFAAPRSYTGEHVLELHGHGGPVVLDMLVTRVLQLGARLARAGEFSERAFLNGKLDLAQAEAIADLIQSGSAMAARCAVRSLQGAFSKRVRQVVETITLLRVHIEAAIDFPEEEVDFLEDQELSRRMQQARAHLDDLAQSARQGSLLRDGIRVVIAGLPNAGKSSLFNTLVEQDRVIVNVNPGTTRDLIEEAIQLDGMPLHVADTAGLRDTQDEVETEGVRRAHQAMHEADRILLVMDDSDQQTSQTSLIDQLPADSSVTLVRNKIDLTGRTPGLSEESSLPVVALSVKTGAGVPVLRDHLKACMGFEQAGESTFLARRRHLAAIDQAREHLARGYEQLELRAGELLAEELRLVQQSLGEIVGEFTSEELLGRIFAEFCIGK